MTYSSPCVWTRSRMKAIRAFALAPVKVDCAAAAGGLLEFRRGRGISVAGTPERGAVVQRVRELVDFARRHGYRVDELVRIIEDVG
jgi:hypothetical protein